MNCRQLYKKAVDIYERPFYQRPISATIGRVNSPLMALLVGSSAFLKPGPDAADLEPIVDKYERKFKTRERKDIPLAVYANHVRPIENLKRIWRRKELSIPGRVIGTAAEPFNDFFAALGRADHYNPFAHSISSFVADKAIQSHELGHATDFQGHPAKTLYALSRTALPVMLEQEGKASKYGIEYLQQYLDEDTNLSAAEKARYIRNANRKLTAAYGSYLGAGLNSIIPSPYVSLATVAAGHGVGAAAQPFGRYKRNTKKKKKEKDK